MLFHTQLVNQAAFIVSQSNRRDEITIYSHKTVELVYMADEERRGVARNLIWVGINGSRRQNNHIKKI